MTEVNDELTMPCAQCCRKHLSAAISFYADTGDEKIGDGWWTRMLIARALINLTEAAQGYGSHRTFAVGLIVHAETECTDTRDALALREYRLAVEDGSPRPPLPPKLVPCDIDWYRAHVVEAEREYPDIRTAVEREPFYRNNMSDAEFRQAEVNYRLAQLRWLDENVFGNKPKEKGEEHMATKATAKAATKKAGKTKVPAVSGKNAACKGGKCKK